MRVIHPGSWDPGSGSESRGLGSVPADRSPRSRPPDPWAQGQAAGIPTFAWGPESGPATEAAGPRTSDDDNCFLFALQHYLSFFFAASLHRALQHQSIRSHCPNEACNCSCYIHGRGGYSGSALSSSEELVITSSCKRNSNSAMRRWY